MDFCRGYTARVSLQYTSLSAGLISTLPLYTANLIGESCPKLVSFYIYSVLYPRRCPILLLSHAVCSPNLDLGLIKSQISIYQVYPIPSYGIHG